MANANGIAWIQWIINGIITVAIAAVAAFGGMKVGVAESKATIIQIEKRLDRIELKLDRVIERRQADGNAP